MHMPLNYTSINLCKYTTPGCFERALKSEKVNVDKLQRKTPFVVEYKLFPPDLWFKSRSLLVQR
jgi:hypothetical protein